MTQQISKDRLRELFRYREDGHLVYRKKYWKKNVGDTCGYPHCEGYLQVQLDGCKHLVHRLVYLWHHGEFDGEVDHKNGERTDNRIENLRFATRTTQCRNRSMQSNNTSGVTGVHWSTTKGKWVAHGTVRHRTVYISCHDTIEEATAAREAFIAEQGGYTERHGK